MKHLSRFLVALLLVVGFSNVKAQDSNNPWQINVSVNAVDFYPTNDMQAAGITGKWFDEYFNLEITGISYQHFQQSAFLST